MSKAGSATSPSLRTTPLVSVKGVTKSFGGAYALRGVDLELFPGEVHALLGENGAGKSTLIKILSGALTYDQGSIELAGDKVVFNSPADSRRAGVAVVYQDLSLVGSLSVGANLMLGREPRTRLGFLKKRRLMAEASAFLAAHGIPLDPRVSVDSLPFAFRQMTEISKALMGEVRVLILDEPTSALSGGEEQILFDAIRTVTRRGVGVIYVTHRLNEVFRISDRVTVFRDGANAGLFETPKTDMKTLIAAIIGSKGAAGRTEQAAIGGAARAPRHTGSGATADPVLTLSHVGNDRLRDLNLSVGEGEIRGLAGLIGSGRTEILETIFGLRQVEEGDIRISDPSRHGARSRGSSPADAIDRGVALVPEDRHLQGLVQEHSIERNISLPRLPYVSKWGWLRHGISRQQAAAAIRNLAIKAPGPSAIVKYLSGGNQQKVVFAKWSNPRPLVLLLDEPTVGVDVGAREEIYGLIEAAAGSGTCVLVVSSDLVELLRLCDRISIVIDGHVARTVERGEVGDAEELHHLIQAPSAKELQTT